MKLSKLAVAIISATASVPVWALGLGPLEARSALNEPFSGRIEIIDAKPSDFDALRVQLAAIERFRRAGIPVMDVALALDFAILRGDGGRDYVVVSTRDPMREPVLNFLLEATWEGGQLFREYTVLVDPPGYNPMPVARVPAPAAPTPKPAPAPAPARSEVAPAPAGRVYGPVSSGDTLYRVASRYTGGANVNQMMMALLAANPDAFVNGNINGLKKGAILEIPSDAEARRLSPAEALAEVRAQSDLWRSYRARAVPVADAPPAPAPAAPAAPAASVDDAAATDEGRLKLVAPEDAIPPDSSDKVLLEEALDTRSQEAQDLAAKLREANDIIDLMQRQLSFKDEELARLQQKLMAERSGEPMADEPMDAPAVAMEDAEPAAAPDIGDEALEDEFADLLTLPPLEADAQAPAVAEEGAETAPPAMDEPAAELSEAAIEPEAEAAPEPMAPEAEDDEPVRVEVGGGSPLDALPIDALKALLPPGLVDSIPGGLRTLLGGLAIVVLGIVALLGRALRGRGRIRDAGTVAVPPPVTERSDSTIEDAMRDDITTNFLRNEEKVAERPEPAAPAPAPERLEATVSDEPEPVEDVDPLEELNVFLAYERFDQAEELVRDMIARHPNVHEYKLRLLEVFYSASDKASYEREARVLRDAVGDNHPLMETAVAMWQEMSPGRALFDVAGADDTTSEAAGAAFVDLGGDDDAGAATLAIGSGEPDAVERAGDPSFDITADNGLFDLTAATSSGAASDDDGDLIDLTAAEGVELDDDQDLLDVSGNNDALGGDDDFFDLSDSRVQPGGLGQAAADPTEATSPEQVTDAEDDNVIEFDLSDTVAPPLAETLATDSLDDLDDDEDGLTFEVSDLADDDAATVDDDVTELDLDATGLDLPAGDDTDELTLEFESPLTEAPEPATPATADEPSTALEDPLDLTQADDEAADTAAPTLDITEAAADADSGTDALDLTGAGVAGDLPDLGLDDPEAPAAGEDEDDIFDLTLGETQAAPGEATQLLEPSEELFGSDTFVGLEDPQTPADDSLLSATSAIPEGLDEPSTDAQDDPADFDFDLAETGDLSRLVVDETLELPAEEVRALSEAAATAKSPEVPTLDSDFEAPELSDDDLSIDFDLSGFDEDDGDADDEGQFGLDDDDMDTKLNLAKAYIELGDHDGARAILTEVREAGSDDQKAQAVELLAQMG